MHQFHLGPVGGLRVLPSPSLGGGPDATAARIGGVHRSLAGRVTVDRLAVKRAWTLTWPYLDPDTHAWLDALHLGAVAGPVWLLDPQRRNRLPARVATGGSVERTTAGFAPTAGTVAWSTAAPTSGTGIAGGVVWTVPATSAQLLADPVPVLPGEALCVSAWVASTVVQVGLIAAFYTPAGAFAGLDSSTSTTVTPAAGQRLALTVTPPSGAGTARVGVITDASPAGGPVATTGWQLESGTAASGWAPGGAAAQVAVDALTAGYPLPGAWATTLTLLEV